MMSTSSGYSSPKLCDRTSLLTPSSCHKMMVWWGGERAYIRNLILPLSASGYEREDTDGLLDKITQ